MSTPSLTPYAMTTIFGDGSHRLSFNGELVRYYSTWEGDIEVSPNGLADLLNDAFTKGVETERARLSGETPEQTIARVNTPEHLAAMKRWAESFTTIDKVEQVEVPPSLQPLLDQVADAWSKHPSKAAPGLPSEFIPDEAAMKAALHKHVATSADMLAAAKAHLRAVPGVTGTGFDGVNLRAYVADKTVKLPAEIDGFKVVMVESGDIEAQTVPHVKCFCDASCGESRSHIKGSPGCAHESAP